MVRSDVAEHAHIPETSPLEKPSPGLACLPAAETINRGARFLLMVLVARSIGVDAYGGWLIAGATGLILTAGGDVGLATVMTTRMAAEPALRHRYAANILALTPLLIILVFGVLLTVSTRFAGASGTVLVFVGTGGMLECMALFVLSPLRAEDRPLPESGIRLLQGLALMSGGGALFASGAQDARAFAALFLAVGIVSFVAALALTLVSCRPSHPVLDVPMLRGLIPQALPAFLSITAWLIYFRVDLFVLALVRDTSETGAYGAAYNVAFGLAFVPVMLGRGLLPRFAAQTSMDALRSAFFLGLRGAIIAGFAFTVALAAVTPLLQVAYGEAFSAAWAPYLILAVAQGLFFVSHVHQVLLWARGRTGIVWALTSAMLVCRIILSLALLPPFGAMGAACAAAISEATLIALQVAVVRRLLREPQPEAGRDAGGIAEPVAAKAA